MGRPLSFDPIKVGRAVEAERARGVPWKLLERKYKLCRTRLWLAMRQAQATEEDVYKHLNAGRDGGAI